MVLEVYTDASMRHFKTERRSFGCSGVLCSTTGDSNYVILPDTTNNKAELIAIYLGVDMANRIRLTNPAYDEIHLFSDSQFGIYGLTKWIYVWLRTMDANGIMYGSNKQPVKNQELFAMILSYMANNNLKIHFHHMLGHVRVNSQKMLIEANEAFRKSNGYYLKPEDIYKICYYNDIVDKTSRAKLDAIDPNRYPIMVTGGIEQMQVRIPRNINHYVC